MATLSVGLLLYNDGNPAIASRSFIILLVCLFVGTLPLHHLCQYLSGDINVTVTGFPPLPPYPKNIFHLASVCVTCLFQKPPTHSPPGTQKSSLLFAPYFIYVLSIFVQLLLVALCYCLLPLTLVTRAPSPPKHQHSKCYNAADLTAPLGHFICGKLFQWPSNNAANIPAI